MEPERVRLVVGWKIALGFGLALLLLLLPFPLPHDQHRLLAIWMLTLVFWITEALPLPVTALVAMTLCALLGILPPKQAFAGLGNPIIFLFLGAFLLAEAVHRHGLDRRWMEWLLSKPWFTQSPFRLLIGFSVTAWGLSAWMSNTATTASLYPLAWQTFQTLRTALNRPEPFGTALMLLCAYASSVGGVLTPIGTPPNLIGLGFLEKEAGVHFGFLNWVFHLAPIGAVMLVCLLAYAWWWTKGIRQHDGGHTLTPQRLGNPLTSGERNTLIAFGVAVGLWLVSGLAALCLESPALVQSVKGTFVHKGLLFFRELPEAVPALVGAFLLFLLPTEGGRPTLTWQDAQRIDWGTILLFAGGLTLGDALFQTGLAQKVGETLLALPFADTSWGLTLWGTTIAVWFTEIVSNTAAANILVPIVLAAAKEASVSPLTPVLGTVIGCSFAFTLPIATPPNAIIYASGLVPIRQMIQWGVTLNFAAILTVVGILLLY